MGFLITNALLVMTWLVASAILVQYLRYRRRTTGGRQWQEFKARLPGWVKQIEMLIQVSFFLALTFLFVVALLWLHAAIHPNTDKPTSMAFGLLLFSSLFSALAPSMILANIFSWSIPPMRRANLTAFAGPETASFKGANMGLIKFGAVLVPICFAVAAFAVYDPWVR
jgi:hypothetical protein